MLDSWGYGTQPSKNLTLLWQRYLWYNKPSAHGVRGGIPVRPEKADGDQSGLDPDARLKQKD